MVYVRMDVSLSTDYIERIRERSKLALTIPRQCAKRKGSVVWKLKKGKENALRKLKEMQSFEHVNSFHVSLFPMQ